MGKTKKLRPNFLNHLTLWQLPFLDLFPTQKHFTIIPDFTTNYKANFWNCWSGSFFSHRGGLSCCPTNSIYVWYVWL